MVICSKCDRVAVALVRDSSYCWRHLPAWSLGLVLVARLRRLVLPAWVLGPVLAARLRRLVLPACSFVSVLVSRLRRLVGF